MKRKLSLEKREQLIALTRELMERYWQGDSSLVFKHMHPDIMWIGSMDEEFLYSASEMKKRLKNNLEKAPKVYLKDEEYEAAYCGENTCVVVGRFVAYTKPESGILLSEKQRVSFVWSCDGGKDLIRHLHLSNALHIQSEEEYFPTRAGKETYEYVTQILREQKECRKLEIKGINGVTYLLAEHDILYLAADGNYTEIFCFHHRVRVKKSLIRVTDALADGHFAVCGRKYVVNLAYIEAIDGSRLHMADQSVLEIPSKQVGKLQEALELYLDARKL